MLPFRRVVCPLSHIPSHDHSPSVSEEAWGGPSEADGLRFAVHGVSRGV